MSAGGARCDVDSRWVLVVWFLDGIRARRDAQATQHSDAEWSRTLLGDEKCSVQEESVDWASSSRPESRICLAETGAHTEAPPRPALRALE